MINEVMDEIIHPKSRWDTRGGFWPYTLKFFIFSMAVDVFLLLPLTTRVLPSWVLLFPFGAVALYWFIFATKRSWLGVVISRKTNVVLAYNLEGMNKDFLKKYNFFVKNLENKIRENNLGNEIRIISMPSDTRFKEDDVAEAKTRLGITDGSTLVIWGHAVHQKNGKVSFRTKFSCEFGAPKGIKRSIAKIIFKKDIARGNSLIQPTFDFNVESDVLDEQILESALFILGLTAASYPSEASIIKAIKFLDEFMKLYHSSNLTRKFTMGSAVGVVEERLKKLKSFMAEKNLNRHDYKSARSYFEDIIKIDKYNYSALIGLAFCCESMGERPEAMRLTNEAAQRSPANSYEHLFNFAYFALEDNNFSEAIRNYDAIPADASLEANSIRVFLYDKYLKTHDPKFLFAEGLIALKFQGDIKSGKKLLKDFLKKARKSEFQILINKASSLLGEY